MELTYTQTLFDGCPKPLRCARCGHKFQIGDTIHEIPLHNEYDLYCGECAEDMRLIDD